MATANTGAMVSKREVHGPVSLTDQAQSVAPSLGAGVWLASFWEAGLFLSHYGTRK